MMAVDEQVQPNPASTNSADEMLAQLAGAEIDRLLAENNADSPTPGGAELPAEPVKPITKAAAAVDEAPVTPKEAAPDATPTDLTATAPTASTPTDAVNVGEPTVSQTTTPRQPETTSSPVANAPAPSEVQLAADGKILAPAASNTGAEDDSTLPAYVRYLTILASPLDAFPEWVRNAVGTFGLITLLNAIALLVYVRFIRHK